MAKHKDGGRLVRASAPLHKGESTRDEAGSRDLLARLLDVPHLARVVPHLPPETLHRLIRHGGLDACEDLVVAATPQQLTSVLDFDLWRSAQPGRDEQFDPDRFGEWLELLGDADGPVGARIVAALDADLVIVGLSHYIRVFDPATIALPASIEDELSDIEVTPSASLESKLGGYLVRAIREDGWDSIVALLLALNADYHTYFHTVMRGCRRLSNSTPEIDGLDNLLTEPEQRRHDVALSREHRRSQQGYSTPADARAFLQMARQSRSQRPNGPRPMNPIAAAYFRAADDAAASANDDAVRLRPPSVEPSATNDAVQASLHAVVGLLADSGFVWQQPRALLEGTSSQPSRLTRIRRLMEYLLEKDATAYLTRSQELAFLANTLAAGCSIQSRAFTPQEASAAAVGVCNLGLECWPTRWPETESRRVALNGDLDAMLPDTFLADHDLVMAFEVGWAVLHEDVSLFVAKRLSLTLKDVRCIDREIQAGLTALRRELVKQHSAGTPWRARKALDALTMLDMPAWASLVGLLDECPVLPEALTATLKGHAGAVSATAFEFISTTEQIGDVRAFMGKLLDTLSR